MENMEIRLKARANGVAFWKIADQMGISEATLTRLLRHQVDAATKRQIYEAIRTIRSERKQNE